MRFRSKFQRFMWRAALGSLACLVLLQALYMALGGALLDALRVTALTCLYHFAVRLLIGEGLIPRLDFSRVNGERSWFRVRNWELALYRRIGVHRWKGNLPTYDPAEFDLQAQCPAGLVRSTCRSEITHELNALASFVPLLLVRWFGALPVFLITSIFAALFDLIFVIVQRYNRPRLLRLAQMKRCSRGREDEPNDRGAIRTQVGAGV